jgi:hypothetical protein
MHYHLARLKSGGPDVKFWWTYHETESSQALGEFEVAQESSGRDYGVCFNLGEGRLALAATTFGGPAKVTLRRQGGFDGYRFEKGCFDMTTGAWRPAGPAVVEVGGGAVTITLAEDSGQYKQAACYVRPNHPN